MITVILNQYNRPYTLESQIAAVKNQTVKPEKIMVWCNKGNAAPTIPNDPEITVVQSNVNWKFHGRFTLALLAQTEYIAMFDDDVIPGNKWFENCINVMKTNPGILGSTGVILHKKAYNPNHKFGWNASHNTKVERVDLVGHSWFFKQEYAKYMWYEKPVSWDNGEDIMFSYLCQKYGNINTFVPPHPDADKELWGNYPGRENGWGSDANATYIHVKNHYPVRDAVCAKCVENGWKTVRNVV